MFHEGFFRFSAKEKCFLRAQKISIFMNGLILAGGRGTMLRPLTFTGNKHMIPIANKPMLFHGLDHLMTAGIKEIGVVLGPIREGVEEALGDGSKF
jgi:glucose-1-phosphate thymidylyltransferase